MPGRITTTASFLDLVDCLAYGGFEEWRMVYQAALRDPEVRAEVLRAARFVEPDFADAGALWMALVARMPPLMALGDAAEVAPHRSRRGPA